MSGWGTDICFKLTHVIFMWDLVSRPGLEPQVPALGARVLATGPPGKSCVFYSLALKVTHPESLGLIDQAYCSVAGYHTRTRIPGDCIIKGNPGGHCTLATRRTTHIIPQMQMRKQREGEVKSVIKATRPSPRKEV